MEAAARRMVALGGDPSELSIAGFEIHDPSAREARRLVKRHGVRPKVNVGDFLDAEPTQGFDAVIGNPPYVRFHDFSGPARSVAIEAALRQGVRLTKLASSWASFVVHSSAFLKPAGRLAFVLPAELLAANYASDVRRFLLERFASVSLVMFEGQVFPGVMTEAVLLLCEGTGGTDHFTVRQLRSAEDLAAPANTLSYRPLDYSDKWTGALLSGLDGPLHLERLAADNSFVGMGGWGYVALGSVTGSNAYFSMSPKRAVELGISRSELVRISPPGSHHLRAIRLTSSAVSALGRRGQQTLMFRPSSEPSKAALEYIRQGERDGVDLAYKCRVRTPWWQVPQVPVADLLVTCMNADTPRLVTNEARVRHLNSVHGLYLAEGHRDLGIALAVASLNSATMLGAELVGRSYGGGILKLEPSEALRLPLPSSELVRSNATRLVELAPILRRLIGNGLLLDAVDIVDETLLGDACGLRAQDIADLRHARSHLATRRSIRGASKGVASGS